MGCVDELPMQWFVKNKEFCTSIQRVSIIYLESEPMDKAANPEENTMQLSEVKKIQYLKLETTNI